MSRLYLITLLILSLLQAGFGQQRSLNQIIVPASLANAEKIQLNFTKYYTLGYEPLVGNGTIEAVSWDGYTDKIKISLVLKISFNNATQFTIYKEGEGKVKTITCTPAGEVQLNALSVHVPVSFNGNSLTTPVFQYGFDKLGNISALEYIYIPASLLKNYDKVGNITKIVGGGKEDMAGIFKALSFGIPTVSHFGYFKFAEAANTEASMLNNQALAAARKKADDDAALKKKDEDLKKKADDELKKKEAAAKAPATAGPAAGTSKTATSVKTTNTAGAGTQVTMAAPGAPKPADIGVGQDGKYYVRGTDNAYKQISNEEYQSLKRQNAALKNPAAAAPTAPSNEQIMADFRQKQQAMTDKFNNQIAETQRKSDERMALGMQSYYAAEAVRNGRENLSNLSSLSGNYATVEELEAEFNEKYYSINQEVESLNQARDQQLQASYNYYAADASESGKAIGQAAVAVGGLLNSLKADKEKKEAQEALRKARAEAKAEMEAKRKAAQLQLRNNFLSKFPDGGVPLSSHKVSTNELYFFSYIFDKSTIGYERPLIAVSNVFPVAQYGDGTWPFKNNITGDLKKIGGAGAVTLVGYYASKDMADQMHASFLSLAGKCQLVVKEVAYKGKKAGSGGSTDFWGNGAKKTAAAKDSTGTAPVIKKTADDFWQNGKKADTTAPKKAVKKDDFWNN